MIIENVKEWPKGTWFQKRLQIIRSEQWWMEEARIKNLANDELPIIPGTTGPDGGIY